MTAKSKNKYLFIRVSHFLKGLLFSLYYSFIYTKRKKTIIFNSSCNIDFTWNSKSLFLNGKEKFEEMGYEIFYVISDKKKREELQKKYGDYFIGNQSLSELNFIYTSAVWVLSTLETPCSGIFLNKNRVVFHLGHGTPIKNIGLCENTPSILKKIFYMLNDTNISLYLSTSEYFSPYMKKAFGTKKSKVIVSPQPRIFDFINRKHNSFELDKNKKYILYAPTWRPYSNVRIFPFDNFDINQFNNYLIEKNIVFLIRLHPEFEDGVNHYLRSNIINFNSKMCPDVSDALDFTSAMITDYSSIYCDYLLLNKPVAILAYDIEEYNNKIGFSHDYNDILPKYRINSKTALFDFCNLVHGNQFDTSSQEQLCNKLNFVPTDVDVIDYNINIIDQEYKKKWKRE
ncbi:CDP-glycerol glycerophosphotransferase family protein [Providencia rettgeri]|uniref:CDP-glycerol glycerophosphotransferase family protein n=1 Tax=Providencia rettgeri TaxID=587 RepID=UPI00235DF3DD|nr:CDP-glycerol glycerophosphotransferase family protein [Providencia rettgeri]